MFNITFFIILVLLNYFLFLFNYKIANKLNLFDHPNTIRKIHKHKIPITGGTIFYLNLLLIILFKNNYEYGNFINLSHFNLSVFILCLTLIFFIGIYDDKYNLSPNKKLLYTFLVCVFFVYFNANFRIKELNFLFYSQAINLNSFSFIFTIFCFLVFMNAFNMIDGINGLSVSYFFICFFYLLISGFDLKLFFYFCVPIIFFLFNNFSNKIFLGDGGALMLAFLLSCFFIQNHNLENIYADQIVLLMILPGLDMIRVTFVRIINNKHAFDADNNHLHHILLAKYGKKISYSIIITLILISSLFSITFDYKYINLFLIIFLLIIYLVLVRKKIE